MAIKAVALLAVLLAAAAVVEAGSASGVRPNLKELAKSQARRGLKYRKYTKDDLGDQPGPRDTDSECSEWKVGTATGYSTDGTDKGDLPMAPNDLGEYVVPGKFFKARNVVAVDGSDWEDDRYRNMEVALEGVVGTLQIWDVCQDKDCADDNPKCCSTNMATFSDPGYLVDVETHAAKELWGLEDAQNWLVAPVWYRICTPFDHMKDVDEFDMECTGLEGDGVCSTDSGDHNDDNGDDEDKEDQKDDEGSEDDKDNEDSEDGKDDEEDN